MNSFVLSLLINLAAVPDSQHENNELSVLYFREQSIISDAITPLAASVGGQAFAMHAWIGAAFQILSDPAEDQRGSLLVKLFEVFERLFGKFDVICH